MNDQAKAPAEDKILNAKAQHVYSRIINRNNFYSKNLRFLIIVMLTGIASLICLLLSIYFLNIKQQKVYYIPTKIDGRVIKAENLQAPETDGAVITDTQIKQWAQKVIPSVYNFNFLSSESNFRSMLPFFTPEGFREYRSALEVESQTMDTVRKGQKSVQGSGCGANTVTILRKGIRTVQGYPIYVWQLEMPVVARYVSSNNSNVLRGKVRIDIQRVPRLLASNGIAIYRFIISDSKFHNGDAEFDVLCREFYQV